jgi:hypothetical protein
MAFIGMSAVWAGKWATATADCVGGPSELPKCSDGWQSACAKYDRHSRISSKGGIWSNIGHGHYCVRSDGGVFSHSDASANFETLSFEFGTGDVLRFEYDPKQGKLTVQNQKGGRYEWSVERKGEKYAVCAYLYDIGDAAELMDS